MSELASSLPKSGVDCNAGKGEKDIAAIISQHLTEQKDLIDTIHNCLIAAGGNEDIDELEKEVNLAGKKPSDFIRKQFQELQKDNKNLLKIIWAVITNINNNRKIERRVPLWSAVADFCGLGSTSAGKLCERLGFRDDITVGKENPPK